MATEATGRERMLARLVGHARAHGLPADASLRQFAEQLGTSHRMLTYYFGSRERMLATLLTALRTEEREWLMSTARDWSLRDAVLAMWSYYTDPAREREHQVFFYVFSLALQDPAGFGDLLGSLDAWVELTTQLAMDEGDPPDRAEARAQLVVSSVRGLLVDRLRAGDQLRIDSAFTLLLDTLLPVSALPTTAAAGEGTRRRARVRP
jgi:AcrR family transcriptional regulator